MRQAYRVEIRIKGLFFNNLLHTRFDSLHNCMHIIAMESPPEVEVKWNFCTF